MSKHPASPAENAAGPEDQDHFEVKRRLAFLELTPEDAERLRALSPLFASHAREFVDHFYRHLFRFPETSRFLKDERLVTRLKELQLAHLHSMLSAAWDDDYVARRHRVGSVHADTGIEPEFFLGSYQMYLSYYMKVLEEHAAGDGRQVTLNMQSLVKAVMLDIGLTLDAYFLKSTDELRHALDMYWRANAELRQFAQLASHDLKTPLATVANLCDEALDEFGDQMPAGACELIERAKQRSYRMSHMIDDLLAATITDPADENLKPVPLGEVMADVIDRLQGPLLEKGAKVEQPAEWPKVLGNQPRLCEAFYNLLSNAVKFSHRRPAIITLAVRQDDGEVTIELRDNGPGIPAEELQRIFHPFRRLPGHRAMPGSGLGLYFTKSLVEQQGGRIWAESKLGQGASFFVALRSVA